MVSVLSEPEETTGVGRDSLDGLISRATAGDRAAMEDLLRAIQGRVYVQAWRLACDPGAAEDITQEVLLKVAVHLKKYKPGTNFRAWVARITVNQVHDYRRTEARTAVQALDPPATAPPAESALLLHEALGILSCKEREALVLTEIEGYTSGEAAAILGCLSITVRTRAAYARKKLRHYLSRRIPEWRSES